jgi:hypothetical protein
LKVQPRVLRRVSSIGLGVNFLAALSEDEEVEVSIIFEGLK